MADRSPYLQGLNAFLGLFSIFFAIGGAVVYLGPGQRALEGARSQLLATEGELDGFDALRAANPPLGEKERSVLDGVWQRMAVRFPDVVTESDLTALASAFFQKHGVAQIKVSFDGEAAGVDPLAASRLLSPDGAESVEVKPNPMRVRFEVPFQDVRGILSALQGDDFPGRVESAELQRTPNGVAVELRLTVFSRGKQA